MLASTLKNWLSLLNFYKEVPIHSFQINMLLFKFYLYLAIHCIIVLDGSKMKFANLSICRQGTNFYSIQLDIGNHGIEVVRESNKEFNFMI